MGRNGSRTLHTGRRVCGEPKWGGSKLDIFEKQKEVQENLYVENQRKSRR